MLITDYFERVLQRINALSCVFTHTIEFLEFDRREGMIRGSIQFLGGYRLQLMEYIIIDDPHTKYRFHFMDSAGNFVFRYNNAPHHKNTATFPHHKHLDDGSPVESPAHGLIEVLDEIERYIATI